MSRIDPGERLMRRVDVRSDAECWEWQGCHNADGYGSICVEGRMVGTHRVAYEHFVGAIPPGLVVRHQCDNRTCVNPHHLLVGTQKQNVQDAVSRGRHAGQCISPSDAELIRKRLVGAKRGAVVALAREFGVSHSLISMINSGKRRRDTQQ